MGMWVQSLVGELGSLMLWGQLSLCTVIGRPSTAKKKKKKRKILDGVLLKITINTLHVNVNNIL